MSIENIGIIDFVSLDKYGNTVLTISDHLEWDTNNEHLFLLQEKINAYINAIESGALYENYPAAKGKKIAISLSLKYWPSSDALQFLEKVRSYLNSNGYDFSYKKLVGTN
jgi:hypothetical protein